MAKGINISIASDTREFSQGVKSGVIDPLDDAEDALKDVAKQGDKAGDKLERSFKEAREATSDFKREQKELGEAMQHTARSGGRSWHQVTDDVEEGSHRAGESVKEFGDEAKQNVGETFSSFRGDITDFGQIAQDTLGGLTSSLEGIPGVAAVAAGAAGIGLIINAITQAGQESQEFKERVQEIAGQMIESGRAGHRSFDDLIDDVRSLATETDDSKTNLKDLQAVAKSLHRPLAEVVSAYEQGGDKLDDIIKASQKQQRILEDSLQTEKDSYGWNFKKHAEISSQNEALKKSNGLLTEQRDVLKVATEAQKIAAKAGISDLQLKKNLISQVNEAYDDAAGDVGTYIDTETGLFDASKYVAAMQARQKALEDYQNTLATSGLSAEAKKFLESQGQDAAAKMLAGYQAASPEVKGQLAAIWKEAGSEASGKATEQIKAGLPKSVKGPDVQVDADTSSYDRTIRKIKRSNPVMYVTIRGRPGRGLP